MRKIKLKAKKCPECGKDLAIVLYEIDKFLGTCTVYYHCECGWWLYTENASLSGVVEGEE